MLKSLFFSYTSNIRGAIGLLVPIAWAAMTGMSGRLTHIALKSVVMAASGSNHEAHGSDRSTHCWLTGRTALCVHHVDTHTYTQCSWDSLSHWITHSSVCVEMWTHENVHTHTISTLLWYCLHLSDICLFLNRKKAKLWSLTEQITLKFKFCHHLLTYMTFFCRTQWEICERTLLLFSIQWKHAITTACQAIKRKEETP